MKSSWQKYQLRDLITIKHGYAYKGEHFSKDKTSEVLVTPGNFSVGGGFKEAKFKYYNGPIQDAYILNVGDLIVTMTDLSKESDTLGYPALIPESSNLRYHHNQRVGLVSIKKDDLITKGFLYFLMCTTQYRNEILASLTGTSVKHTSPSKILNYSFNLPPLDVQEKISETLFSLELKINNNTKMNKTLEKIAQRIFKSWFIDFDPVKANAEGLPFAGLSPDIQSLFPSEFVESEMGLVPKGWEFNEASSFMKAIGGFAFKSKDFKLCGIPVIKIKNINNTGNVDTENTDKYDGVVTEKMEKFKLTDGDIILAMTGATVGKVGLFVDYGEGALLNQRVAKLSRSDGNKSWFVYLSSIQASFYNSIVQTAYGSAQPNISSDGILSTKTINPNSSVIDEFENIVRPFFEKIISNRKQNRLLEKLRDKLLPKLLSGQIQIDEQKKAS